MSTKLKATYLLHDSNSRNDEAILELIAEYGMEGYGTYWFLVEMLRESSELRLNWPVRAGLAKATGVELSKLKQMLSTCFDLGLFAYNSEHFWSERLRRDVERSQKISEMRAKSGKIGGEKSKRRKVAFEPKNKQKKANAYQNEANAKQMLSKCSANAKQMLSKNPIIIEEDIATDDNYINSSTNVSELNNHRLPDDDEFLKIIRAMEIPSRLEFSDGNEFLKSLSPRHIDIAKKLINLRIFLSENNLKQEKIEDPKAYLYVMLKNAIPRKTESLKNWTEEVKKGHEAIFQLRKRKLNQLRERAMAIAMAEYNDYVDDVIGSVFSRGSKKLSPEQEIEANKLYLSKMNDELTKLFREEFE